MNLRNHLRNFLVEFLKKEWVDYVRCLSFSSKIKKFSRPRRKLYEFFEPEMEILPKLLSKNFKLGVDIGANYGSYAFFLSKIGNENTKIFSFEPIPRSYEILKKVIKKFNLKNVTPVNLALGNTKGYTNMIIPDNITGLAHICSENEKEKKGVQKVRIEKLDNFVNKLNKKVDFIKCDVEGKELDVVKGAIKTIKKFKPLILCEIEQRHSQKYGVDINEAFFSLLKMGYKAFIYENKKLVNLKKTSEKYANYFFIHKSKIKFVDSALFLKGE